MFKSAKYPLAAEFANRMNIKEGTRSGIDVKHMLRNGHPVLDIFVALEQAASLHGRTHGHSMAYDYVTGDQWLETACAARKMLNNDFGVEVENGLLEKYFWHICDFAGFTVEEVEQVA